MLIWLRRLVLIVWLPWMAYTSMRFAGFQHWLEAAQRPAAADPAHGFTETIKLERLYFVTPQEDQQFGALFFQGWLVGIVGAGTIFLIESLMRRQAAKRTGRWRAPMIFQGDD